MSTSIKRQLEALAAPQTDTYLRDGRKRAALLVDPSSAAKYDYKDFLSIALEGFRKLQSLNDNFSNFESVLFSDVSEGMERSVHTKEINEKLDENIKKFLRLLSPYLLTTPALHALNWLIVRFHAHQYNHDALMVAVLPHHEHQVFVLVVQILEFKHDRNWDWLKDIQRKGVTLGTKDLIKYLSKQHWLLQFLCTELIQRDHSSIPPSNDVFLKFLGPTIIRLLEFGGEIENSLVGILLSAMGPCLKSVERSYRLTAYAVLADLCKRVKLKDETHKALSTAVCKSILQREYEEHGQQDGMQALAIVLSWNRAFLPGGFLDFFKDANFLEVFLTYVNKNTSEALGNVEGIFWIVWRSSLKVVSKTPESKDADAAVGIIDEVLAKTDLDDVKKELILREAVDMVLAIRTTVDKVEYNLARFLSFCRDLDPRTWNMLLREKGAENDHLLERLDLLYTENMTAVHSNPSTIIFLRLNHPNTVVRMEAVDSLINMEINDDISQEFLSEMVRERLNDENSEVVEHLLEGKSALAAALGQQPQEVYVDLLVRLYDRDMEKWNKVEGQLLELLSDTVEIAEWLPFFLMAVSRRNKWILRDGNKVLKYFPLFLSSISSAPESQVQLEEAISTLQEDFSETHEFQIIPAIRRLSLLVSHGGFPLGGSFLTTTLLVEVLSKRKMFFIDEETSTILDVIHGLLMKVRLSSRRLSENPFEQTMKMLRKRKLCAAVPLVWVSQLFDTSSVLRTGVSMKALWRAAKFVLEDVVPVGDPDFWKIMASTFFQRVVKDVKMVVDLLKSSVVFGVQSLSDSLKSLLLVFLTLQIQNIPRQVTSDDRATEFLTAFIPFLRHSDQQVRKNALRLLAELKTRQNWASVEVEELLERMLKNADRVEADELVISRVLKECFEDQSAAARTKEFWMNLLLRPVEHDSTEKHIRLQTLISLRFVQPITVLSRLHQVLEKLMSAYDKLDVTDLRTLNEILERYSSDTFEARFPLEPDVESKIIPPLLRALRLSGREGIEAPADVVLRQMFFISKEHIGSELFDRILKEIIAVYVDKVNPLSAAAFRRYLKHVRVPARLIMDILYDRSGKSPATSKNVIGGKKVTHATLNSTDFWIRAFSVLETVHNKKKIGDVKGLVEELLDLAKQSILVVSDFEGMEQVDACRHMVFSIVNFHCRRKMAEQNGQEIVDWNLDVPSIVEVVRASGDLGTHQSALALLSTLAEISADNVIQSCMSIFTLAGDKVMRKDDHYSMQVVTHTIEVIVPVMLKAVPPSERHNTYHMILELFTDGLPHIPVHRRIHLFRLLLKVAREVGEDESEKLEGLWIFTVLLSNVYVGKGLLVDVKRKVYPELYKFLGDVYDGFEPRIQLKNLQKSCKFVVENVTELLKDTRAAKRPRISMVSFQKPLISPNFAPAENIQLLSSIVTFVASLLPKLNQTFEMNSDSEDILRDLLSSLLNIQERARKFAHTTDVSLRPLWASLLLETKSSVTEILGQMSWQTFASVMTKILQTSTPATMKIALEELAGVLDPARVGVRKDDLHFLVPLVTVVVQTLQDLTEEIRKSGHENVIPGQKSGARSPRSPASSAEKSRSMESPASPGQIVDIQLGCLYCLKELMVILGKDYVEAWKEILQVSVEFLENENVAVRCEALKGMGAVVRTLKTDILPYLPETMPKLLDVSTEVLNGEEQIHFVDVLDVLDGVISNLATFLSPYMEKIMVIISATKDKKVKKGIKEKYGKMANRISSAMVVHVPLRILFAAFKEVWSTATTENNGIIHTLFDLFNEKLKSSTRADILAIQREITVFLLSTMDRREYVDLALAALRVISLQLSPSLFNAMFARIYQWVVQENSPPQRLLTFYDIVNGLTDTLKNQFVMYAGLVVGHAVKILKGKLAGDDEDNSNLGKEDQELLLCSVFQVLSKFFQYDYRNENGHRYFSADHFDIMMQPLTDQLESLTNATSYEKLSSSLIGALSSLASWIKEDESEQSLLKPFHYQICLKLRSESSQVRLATLQCIEALVESLGDSYELLLPEATVFLNELDAEDDERVELQIQKTRETLTKVLGFSDI